MSRLSRVAAIIVLGTCGVYGLDACGSSTALDASGGRDASSDQVAVDATTHGSDAALDSVLAESEDAADADAAALAVDGADGDAGGSIVCDAGGDTAPAYMIDSGWVGMATLYPGHPPGEGNGIAAGSGGVYWTTSVGTADAGSGGVWRWDLADGGVTQVASTQLTLTTGCPVSDGARSTRGIAVDTSSVYWADQGSVMKVDLYGGAAKAIASGLACPTGLAIDSTSVYWTDPVAGTVSRAHLSGGPPTVLASGQASPLRITVDATAVYWTNRGGEAQADGAVMKVSIGGGAIETLASGQPMPVGIAVHDGYVYWAASDASSIRGGSINRVSSQGGCPATFVPQLRLPPPVAQLPFPPVELGVDSSGLYWMAPVSFCNGPDCAVSQLGYVPFGGTWITINYGYAYAFALDPTHVYAVEWNTVGPNGISTFAKP